MLMRRGYSLIETLIVIAILAVFVGLLIAAVQKVRERSVRLRSENNLRHIVLGLHGYASAKNGKLPGVADPLGYNDAIDRTALFNLPAYIEGESPAPSVESVTRPDGTMDGDRLTPRRTTYISPGDPTVPLWDYQPPDPTLPPGVPAEPFRRFVPPASYAENMVAFTGPPTLAGSFPDGTSNTIAFAERYAIGNRFDYGAPLPSYFSYAMGGPYIPRSGRILNPPIIYGPRRSTFADRGWLDVVPVTENGVTRASVPGTTFQVRPKPEEADASMVQTPFAAGLPVAMFDGSVRTIRPGVAEAVFWAAVTPAGGETAPLD